MTIARARTLAVVAALIVQGSTFRAQGVPTPAEPLLRVGFLKPGGAYTIETIPLEAYVARVLAGEAARESRPAALEALAITIRTFALANLGRHRADGFDLCDQTHCEVLRAASAATERAAAETSGRILFRDRASRAAASVYFSASCGGRTEIPSAVWPGADDPPFLPSRVDDACGGAPVWVAEIARADLLRALHAAGFRGDRLREVSIASRDGSGRVARLKIDGLSPDQISGQDLRVAVGRALGWQHIKSTAFDVRRAGDAYRFSGHGSGHGVGLCVIGSARLAERGQTAEEILARYFPGLEIGALPGEDAARHASGAGAGRAAPGTSAPTDDRRAARAVDTAGVVVALPDGDEGERDALIRTTTRARDELAARLGVQPPPAVTLRVHPTTDDYERVTGDPWFTSGDVLAGELHLLPLAVLRDRGVLEVTIRYGLVRLMTDAVLRSRPMWVREGAAAYFAGADRPAAAATRPRWPEPRPSCPEDRDLAQPVSVGAFSNARAAARACFAKQIAAGRSWRDVR